MYWLANTLPCAYRRNTDGFFGGHRLLLMLSLIKLRSNKDSVISQWLLCSDMVQARARECLWEVLSGVPKFYQGDSTAPVAVWVTIFINFTSWSAVKGLFDIAGAAHSVLACDLR